MASSDFFDLRVRELLEAVAEETPAPAGGSVAAIVTALAAALVEMAARFSGEWEEANGVVAQAKTLRDRAMPLAAEDAEAYEEVLVALRMPKEVEAEIRNRMLADTLSRAAEVPLRIATVAADVAELGALVAEQGNPNLRGDAVAGAVLAEAATRGAGNLVAINLGATAQDERVVRAQALARAAGNAAARALAVET